MSHYRTTHLFVIITFAILAKTWSFEITRLVVPSGARTGSTARMICEYDLTPYRKLYTVRWLKNNIEFYRYDPNSQLRHNFYRIHGLHVNTERSNSTVVYIDHVSKEDTEGLYTCEVTTFPNFVRTSQSKRLTVADDVFEAQELKKEEKGHRHGRRRSASIPCLSSVHLSMASVVIALLCARY